MANELIINTAVVGTDNKTPIYNKEGRFAIYALKELWDGTIGEKRYVPNIGDLVIDTDRTSASKFWIVTALSVDLIPNLKPWGDEPSMALNIGDILTAPGNSTHNATYRAYVDRSVVPYSLNIENRLSFKGTQARYVKIFRGALTEGLIDAGKTKVISGYFDAQGNMTSDSIPLELVGVINEDISTGVTTLIPQRAEYCIPASYTKEELPDNEVLTVVAYSADNHLVSKTQVLVENTPFVKARNVQTKAITHVSLVTPFLSETDDHLIKLPINVPLQGLYLRGRVHYSDGSFRELPVDNTKFTIMGMESYLATMVNQNIPVHLRYTLGANETAYDAVFGDQGYKTQKYNIRTVKAAGAYYVKLFCFPEWQGPINGYRLRWWMYTGERNTFYDVTHLVQHAVNTAGFNPTAYGVSQMLNVSVNLKDVNPLFESYRHAQTLSVILWRQGTERNTNWSVIYDPNQDPAYGVDTYARLQFINYNYWKINVHSGCLTEQEWLQKLYLNTKPFIDPAREVVPPMPTHFRLLVGSTSQLELPVSDWNKTQAIINGLQVNETVYLQWILKTPETNLELGISGLPCWDNNNADLPDVMRGGEAV